MLPTPFPTLAKIDNDALSMMRRRPYRSSVPLFLLGLALSVGAAQGEEHKDREFTECANCPAMVGIPAGSFVMGSPPSESGRFDTEGPQHKVAIKAFALGKYDITSEQFLTFLRDTGVEIVGTHLSWAYLRRPAAAGPFELFSDLDSRIAHYRRVLALFGGLLAALVAAACGLIVTAGGSGGFVLVVPLVLVVAAGAVLAVQAVRLARRVRSLTARRQVYE